MHLTCPRCGLSLTIRSSMIAPPYCPRCLARRREAIELVSAVEPMQAAGGAGREDALRTDEAVN